MNVPVSLIAFALAPRLIAESRADRRGPRLRRRRRGHRHRRALAPRLRGGRRRERRLGVDQNARPDRPLAAAARRLRRDRAALAQAAGPVLDLPHPHPDRRQRRRRPGRRLALLDVLLHLALHAAGARLQRDPRRALLPAAGADDHGLGRHRLQPGDQSRLQAGARGRPALHRRRAALVQPGLGRRRLHDRHPRPVAARRRSASASPS